MKPSIVIHEAERESHFVHDDLDYDYIDRVALDCAVALHTVYPIETAYQPGDWSNYRIILVPLVSLACARARVVDGREWESHAISGMSGEDGKYDSNGVLMAIIDHGTYPVRLGNRSNDLSHDYVCEHWFGGKSQVSGVSVAILLRAISYHLDLIENGVAEWVPA